jgi:hypothetical protein
MLAGHHIGDAGVGTSSPNRGCCAGAPYGSVNAPAGVYLGGTGGDALTLQQNLSSLDEKR